MLTLRVMHVFCRLVGAGSGFGRRGRVHFALHHCQPGKLSTLDLIRKSSLLVLRLPTMNSRLHIHVFTAVSVQAPTSDVVIPFSTVEGSNTYFFFASPSAPAVPVTSVVSFHPAP